jgi:hypothetical protein
MMQVRPEHEPDREASIDVSRHRAGDELVPNLPSHPAPASPADEDVSARADLTGGMNPAGLSGDDARQHTSEESARDTVATAAEGLMNS